MISQTNFNKYFKIRFLTLNVASGCNLNCRYCFEGEQENQLMRPEDAVTIFEKVYHNNLLHYGEYARLGTSFFGGEPLLNFPAIKAVVEHAQKYENCTFGITTNLTMLTDEMMEFFDEHEIGLLVSIDGIKRIHDKNRCNSFNKVRKNVKKLLDIGLVRLIETRMTIHPEDVKDMFRCVKAVINMGIDNIFPYFLTDVPWTDEQAHELERQHEKLIKYILKLAQNPENKRNISLKSIEDAICSCQSFNIENGIPCNMGNITMVSVDPTGNMMPCHQRHYNSNYSDQLQLGNILTDDIMADNILGELEYGASHCENKKISCDGCMATSHCHGWCPSENIDKRGNAYLVPEIICTFNKFMYNLVEKYQKKILSAKNLRSRKLNILRHNLKLEEDFEQLKKMDIFSEPFLLSLLDFQNELMAQSDLLLPGFKDKFFYGLAELATILDQMKGGSISACQQE